MTITCFYLVILLSFAGEDVIYIWMQNNINGQFKIMNIRNLNGVKNSSNTYCKNVLLWVQYVFAQGCLKLLSPV